jgi:hypothetical protein
MRKMSDIFSGKMQIYWGNILLVATLLIFGQLALAQNEPLKINGKEVKEYLMEKYKLRKDDVRSEIQQTPNGPSGKLHINSFERPFTPQNVVITDTSVQGRVRAIAQAFLKEDAALLGITNMDEIREIRIDTTKGREGDYTTVRYSRYIDNLELDGVYIRIDIGPDERIIGVNAEIMPAPPELYEAVKKKTLTEDEIRKIVEHDLGSTKKDLTGMKISEIKKIAIPSPPYVIWTANAGVKSDQGTWGYQIDAFTGEIIKRGYVVIH